MSSREYRELLVCILLPVLAANAVSLPVLNYHRLRSLFVASLRVPCVLSRKFKRVFFLRSSWNFFTHFLFRYSFFRALFGLGRCFHFLLTLIFLQRIFPAILKAKILFLLTITNQKKVKVITYLMALIRKTWYSLWDLPHPRPPTYLSQLELWALLLQSLPHPRFFLEFFGIIIFFILITFASISWLSFNLFH